MKLYTHPFFPAGRPVGLLLAEHGIECEEAVIDLMQGAHHQPPYCELIPAPSYPLGRFFCLAKSFTSFWTPDRPLARRSSM